MSSDDHQHHLHTPSSSSIPESGSEVDLTDILDASPTPFEEEDETATELDGIPDSAEIQRSLDELSLTSSSSPASSSTAGGGGDLLQQAQSKVGHTGSVRDPQKQSSASNSISGGSFQRSPSAPSTLTRSPSSHDSLALPRFPAPPPGEPPQHSILEAQNRRRRFQSGTLSIPLNALDTSTSTAPAAPPAQPPQPSEPSRKTSVTPVSPPPPPNAIAKSASTSSLSSTSSPPPTAAPVPPQGSPPTPIAAPSASATSPQPPATTTATSTPTTVQIPSSSSNAKPLNPHVSPNVADVRFQGHVSDLVVIEQSAYMDPPLDPDTAYAVRFWIPALEVKVTLSCIPDETFAELKQRIWEAANLNSARNRLAQPAYFTFRLLFGEIYFYDTDLVGRLIDLAYVFLEHGSNGSGNLAIEVVLERRIDVGRHLLHRLLPTDRQGEIELVSRGTKLGGVGMMRRWKSRFCVIQGHSMYIFESYKAFKAGKKCLHQIFLGPSVRIRPAQSKSSKTTFAFQVTYPTGESTEETLIFRTHTDAERVQWIVTAHRVQTRCTKRLVVQTAEELESRGLDIVGLFRVAGRNTEILNLTNKVDLGMDPSLGVVDDHDLAGLMKRCIRAMTTPLLSFKLYPEWIKAYKIDDLAARKSHVLEVFSKLTTYKQGLLQYLMLFLRRVSVFQAANKMDPTNLATVFTPNILLPKASSGNTENANSDMIHANGTVRFLIEHARELFPPETRHRHWLRGPVEEPLQSPQFGVIPAFRRPLGAPPPIAQALSEYELAARRRASTTVTRLSSGSGGSGMGTPGSGQRRPELTLGAKLVQAANLASQRIRRSPDSGIHSPYSTVGYRSSPPRAGFHPDSFRTPAASPPGSPGGDSDASCNCAIFHAHWAKPGVCVNCGKERGTPMSGSPELRRSLSGSAADGRDRGQAASPASLEQPPTIEEGEEEEEEENREAPVAAELHVPVAAVVEEPEETPSPVEKTTETDEADHPTQEESEEKQPLVAVGAMEPGKTGTAEDEEEESGGESSETASADDGTVVDDDGGSRPPANDTVPEPLVAPRPVISSHAVPPPPSDIIVRHVKKSALPPGWHTLYSDAGIPYYHNTETGITQWERPQKPVKATTPEQIELLEWLQERSFDADILGQSLLNNDIDSIDTLMEAMKGITAKELVNMLDLSLGAAARLLRVCSQYQEEFDEKDSAADSQETTTVEKRNAAKEDSEASARLEEEEDEGKKAFSEAEGELPSSSADTGQSEEENGNPASTEDGEEEEEDAEAEKKSEASSSPPPNQIPSGPVKLRTVAATLPVSLKLSDIPEHQRR